MFNIFRVVSNVHEQFIWTLSGLNVAYSNPKQYITNDKYMLNKVFPLKFIASICVLGKSSMSPSFKITPQVSLFMFFVVNQQALS